MITQPGKGITWGEVHVGTRHVFADAGLTEAATRPSGGWSGGSDSDRAATHVEVIGAPRRRSASLSFAFVGRGELEQLLQGLACSSEFFGAHER